jgi:ubiquinol-cytochrome c reductase subunit 7
MFQGFYAPVRFMLGWYVWPDTFRHFLAVQNAHKVERGARLQQALKANKVDIRTMLALPVTDHAHPYKHERPWQKVYGQSDPGNLSLYGKWYRSKVLTFYECQQYHKWGMMMDDSIPARGWWARAARTRVNKVQLIHCDRRVVKARMMRTCYYAYLPKDKWMHPMDNISWYTPYVMMVIDEWEEKWGFFANSMTEY